MNHPLIEQRRVWWPQVVAVQLLLAIRMLRAIFVLARTVWRIRPEVGSKVHVTYQCFVDFDSDDRFRLPRMADNDG